MSNLLKKMLLLIVYGASCQDLLLGFDEAFKPIRAKFLICIGKIQSAFFQRFGAKSHLGCIAHRHLWRQRDFEKKSVSLILIAFFKLDVCGIQQSVCLLTGHGRATIVGFIRHSFPLYGY